MDPGATGAQFVAWPECGTVVLASATIGNDVLGWHAHHNTICALMMRLAAAIAVKRL